MASNVHETTSLVFEALIDQEEVDVTEENGETQVIADEWTLVLVGDPLSSVIVALDDESGEPGAALRDALGDNHLAAIRSLDGQLDDEVSNLLAASPDELARALASMIVD